MSAKKAHRTESANATARDGADATSADAAGYMTGFCCELKSEALPGALPEKGNTPQKCAYGLYAEQLTCTAFTKPRHTNFRSWQYRIRPSAADHGEYKEVAGLHITDACDVTTPQQLRWMPPPLPTKRTTFVEGLMTYCGAGDPAMRAGIRIYVYACNASMVNESFNSSDGEMLIVPQLGTLQVTTEFGKLEVPSNFICVIPRGVKFSVAVPASGARGYVCEVFNSRFELPPLGAIGSNGLSNARDFEAPVAAYEDREVTWTHRQKYCDKLFEYTQGHSPFDVVAWHGNVFPYRYDLDKFCVINSVSFDHLDPSIFCVVTAQTGEAGVAVCDFVIFPPRYMVQENTFRPPYYHRNIMAEFMGNIRGVYEAKTDGGFIPGGATLHSPMAAHGPAADVHEKASNAPLTPQAPDPRSQAFMFESAYTMKLTQFAANNFRDANYSGCWKGFKKHFNPNERVPK